MVRAGVPNMLAWSRDGGAPLYVLRAREAHESAEAPAVRFADGSLQLLATSGTCQCHHNLADCPHRQE
jgi:hypothetical protein